MQVKTYQEDFEIERGDRERAHERMSKMQDEIANLTHIVTMLVSFVIHTYTYSRVHSVSHWLAVRQSSDCTNLGSLLCAILGLHKQTCTEQRPQYNMQGCVTVNKQ